MAGPISLKTPTILLITHGSREAKANRDFHSLVRRYAKKHPAWSIQSAFLEIAEPSIHQALNHLSARSLEIDVLPLFLFSAQHLKTDIPRLLDVFKNQHPEVQLRLGKELGPDPQLARLALVRIKPKVKNPGSTVVLFLGRGARDPQALEDFRSQAGNFTKLTRFKKVLPCSMEAAHPSVIEALKEAAGFHPKNVLIVPYLLFRGSWQYRVREQLKIFRLQHPTIEIRMSPPLGFHPMMLEVMDQRWLEIQRG